MDVYRVEYINGEGPYHIYYTTCNNPDMAFYQECNFLEYHMSPKQPGVLLQGEPFYILKKKGKYFGDYKCGFSSIKQLKKWFSKKELELLKKYCFSIVVYKNVIEFVESKKQVAFIPTTEKEIYSGC